MAKSKTYKNYKNYNPTGKGGFGDHPEHINRHGAPRRGESLAELIRVMMDHDITINRKNSDGSQLTETINRKLAWFEQVYKAAMDGKPWANRLIANYHDGLPPQALKLSGSLAVPSVDDMAPEEVAEIETQLDMLMNRGKNVVDDTEDGA